MKRFALILPLFAALSLSGCTREDGLPDPPARQLVPCQPDAGAGGPLACPPDASATPSDGEPPDGG
jgi:hypothetical protein